MKSRPSPFDALSTDMHVLASNGITGTNVRQKAKDRDIPASLVPVALRVYGKTASMKKALAQLKPQA
jgi:hypothetical protein